MFHLCSICISHFLNSKMYTCIICLFPHWLIFLEVLYFISLFKEIILGFVDTSIYIFALYFIDSYLYLLYFISLFKNYFFEKTNKIQNL